MSICMLEFPTPKQKQDLENQLEALQNFSLKQGYQVKGAFKDIASGISFEKRKEFFKLLDLVIAGKVSKVIITYKDRLSRVGFDLFKYLFEKIPHRNHRYVGTA